MSKIVNAARLMKLCEKGRLTAEQNASNSGVYREQVGDAVDNYALHRQAYSVASRAYKMLSKDELKGHEFIDSVMVYLDMIRDNFQGHEGDLAKQAKAKEAEQAEEKEYEEAKEKQVASNVRALRGIRPLDTADSA